jgi:putative ABC transport system ATP-binding protein
MLIRLENLEKSYTISKSQSVLALSYLNLEIIESSCTCFKGGSGSGKTTLLHILACMSKPTSGSYILMGKNISHWSEKFLSKFRRDTIGLIFQQYQLIPDLTVEMNIALPLIPLGLKLKDIKEKIETIAQKTNIVHRLHAKASTLSGGEQQRVAWARALLNEPKILLADEPTAHLDDENCFLLLDMLLKLKKQEKTIIVTTHDPRILEHPVVDRVYNLEKGKLKTSN